MTPSVAEATSVVLTHLRETGQWPAYWYLRFSLGDGDTQAKRAEAEAQIARGNDEAVADMLDRLEALEPGPSGVTYPGEWTWEQLVEAAGTRS